MANSKPSLEELRKKHGLSDNNQTTSNKDDEEQGKSVSSLEEIRKKHGLSDSSKSVTGEQNNSVPSLEDLRKKHVFKPEPKATTRVVNIPQTKQTKVI